MKNFKTSGTIFLTLIGILILMLEIFRSSDHWYLSLIFIILGLVVLPYIKWTKSRKE